MKRKVIFVASSVKHSKDCVAAIDVETKKFYRIVGDENGKEIEFQNYNFIGDIYELPFLAEIDILEEVPLNYQPENVIIDKNIKVIRKVELEELDNYLSSTENLWGGVYIEKIQNIAKGINDYINYYENKNMKYSLYLIKVKKVVIHNILKRRASFGYNHIFYNLSLTDPIFKNIEKTQTLENKYLVVSLGEPFLPMAHTQEKCYKIVAQIF